MIPELFTALKYIGIIGGSTIAGIYIKHWLGKTKEDTEIVLNWEKIHKERHSVLLAEIQRLEANQDKFMALFDEMKDSHEKERLVWEDRFNKQEKYSNGLELELQTLRNGTD